MHEQLIHLRLQVCGSAVKMVILTLTPSLHSYLRVSHSQAMRSRNIPHINQPIAKGGCSNGQVACNKWVCCESHAVSQMCQPRAPIEHLKQSSRCSYNITSD
jgi:hypothetical protein